MLAKIPKMTALAIDDFFMIIFFHSDFYWMTFAFIILAFSDIGTNGQPIRAALSANNIRPHPISCQGIAIPLSS